MRVATFVLGIVFAVTGEAGEALGAANGSNSSYPAATLAEGALAAPTERFTTRNTNAWVNAQEAQLPHGAFGAMGFVPSQSPASFNRSRNEMGQARPDSRQRYNPANIPLPATRTLEDHLLTGFVALMLIAYQLRRKHRFLRPHQFST